MISEKIASALPYIAEDLRTALIRICPVDSGFLVNSINVSITSIGLRITMLPYGRYIEFGTPPHVIKPQTKQALKFKDGGTIVFTKKVMHPGTRPNPFVRTTIRNKLPGIIKKYL